MMKSHLNIGYSNLDFKTENMVNMDKAYDNDLTNLK